MLPESKFFSKDKDSGKGFGKMSIEENSMHHVKTLFTHQVGTGNPIDPKVCQSIHCFQLAIVAVWSICQSRLETGQKNGCAKQRAILKKHEILHGLHTGFFSLYALTQQPHRLDLCGYGAAELVIVQVQAAQQMKLSNGCW